MDRSKMLELIVPDLSGFKVITLVFFKIRTTHSAIISDAAKAVCGECNPETQIPVGG
jgi:hypothetical protein